MDLWVLRAAKPDFVVTVASRVLSPSLDIIGSFEAEAAAKVFTEEMDALLINEKAILS